MMNKSLNSTEDNFWEEALETSFINKEQYNIIKWEEEHLDDDGNLINLDDECDYTDYIGYDPDYCDYIVATWEEHD